MTTQRCSTGDFLHLLSRSPDPVNLRHVQPIKGHNPGIPRVIWLKIELVLDIMPILIISKLAD